MTIATGRRYIMGIRIIKWLIVSTQQSMCPKYLSVTDLNRPPKQDKILTAGN